MTVRHLTLSWSVSRGRDTYGYNICKLRDDGTRKVYRCLGGGYDMQGTVFAEWLQDQYADEVSAIVDRAYYVYRQGQGYESNQDGLYGMYRTEGKSEVRLDGACGLESIERIARAIGLKVKHVTDKRGHLTAFMVATEGEEL